MDGSSVALVAGGSGLVGGHLLDEILERPAWQRTIALVRRPLGRSHARLEERVVDFAALGEGPPLPVAAAAFCCLGTTMKRAGSREAFRAADFDAVLAFARAALAGGTRRIFVVTAAGADARSRIFYNRVKGEVEDALRGLSFETLGIARPSLLLGDRGEPRPFERVAIIGARALAPLFKPFAMRPIEARTVARALLAMAESPVAGVKVHDNAALHVLGA
jgi:uncharacterized protein YbjT (DUF2867 family)